MEDKGARDLITYYILSLLIESRYDNRLTLEFPTTNVNILKTWSRQEIKHLLSFHF